MNVYPVHLTPCIHCNEFHGGKVSMKGIAFLLANHHEFVLGEFVVPPQVSFLAITNQRGLFIQERIGDRMYPVCRYCLRLCDKQDSAYCCLDCYPAQLKKLIEAQKLRDYASKCFGIN